MKYPSKYNYAYDWDDKSSFSKQDKSSFSKQDVYDLLEEYKKMQKKTASGPTAPVTVKKPIDLLEDSITSKDGIWSVERITNRWPSSFEKEVVQYILQVKILRANLQSALINPLWTKHGDQCYGFLRQSLLMKAAMHFPQAKLHKSWETSGFWYCEIELYRMNQSMSGVTYDSSSVQEVTTAFTRELERNTASNSTGSSNWTCPIRHRIGHWEQMGNSLINGHD